MQPTATIETPLDQSFDVNLTVCHEGTAVNVPITNYHSNQEIFQRQVFGFKVKKEKFIRGIDNRRVDEEDIEIVCINCQELIKVREVDSHSKICYKNNAKEGFGQT